MRSITKHCFILLVAVGTIAVPGSVSAAIWAKGSVSFGPGCRESLKTRPTMVPSPDHNTSIEIRCRNVDEDDVAVRIVRQRGRVEDVPIPIAAGSIWRPEELLWAPDSKAFVINGSENAYAGNAFVVFHVYPDRVVASDVTTIAQRDMVKTFPPCRALGLDQSDCKNLEASPEYNMSAIAWGRASRSIVVFAEVPCSSSYGGIMCQVMGYEIDASTGKVLARMNARDLKRRYQRQMAWNMRVPDKPEYRK